MFHSTITTLNLSPGLLSIMMEKRINMSRFCDTISNANFTLCGVNRTNDQNATNTTNRANAMHSPEGVQNSFGAMPEKDNLQTGFVNAEGVQNPSGMKNATNATSHTKQYLLLKALVGFGDFGILATKNINVILIHLREKGKIVKMREHMNSTNIIARVRRPVFTMFTA